MSRQKILSHIILWTLIGSGVCLSFLFIPPVKLMSSRGLYSISIIPLLVVLIYHLIISSYLRFKIKEKQREEKQLIEAGIYGRFSHPTCIALIILSWIIFFFFPDARVLISAFLTTVLVSCWIQLEKSCFKKDRISKPNDVICP